MSTAARTSYAELDPLPPPDWSGWDLSRRPAMGANGKPTGWPADVPYVDVWSMDLGHAPHQLKPRQVKSKKKTTMRADETSEQRRTREETQCKEVMSWKSKCHLDELIDGVPLADSGAEKLASLVGMLVRQTKFAPYCVTTWAAIPLTMKQELLRMVKEKFSFGRPEADKKVMDMLHDRWVDNRHNIRTDHFYFWKTQDAILSHKPVEVKMSNLEWRWLVRYWCTKNFQDMANRNQRNKAQAEVFHTLGRQRLAGVKRKQAKKNNIPVEQVRRYEVYRVGHLSGNKDDPNYVDKYPNDETERVVTQIYRRASEAAKAPGGLTVVAEGGIFSEYLGPERKGRTRGMGRLGPKPSSLNLTKGRCYQANVTQQLTQQLEEERREREKLVQRMKEYEDRAIRTEALLLQLQARLPPSDCSTSSP